MQGFDDDVALPKDDIVASEATTPGAEDDGRNREWQDRARVNLEQTPEGVHTNVERDFEPENLEDGTTKKEIPPAY